jgi:hypothetical protein
MPMPFYSLDEHCELAREQMRAYLIGEERVEQTVDHFLARTQATRAEIVSRQSPLTSQDFAAIMLMMSHRPMPYAVATGDSLGDVVKQYARFRLREACMRAEREWAEDMRVHYELAALGRIV